MKLKHKILLGIVSLLCLFGMVIFLAVNRQVNKLVNMNLAKELTSNLNLGYKLLNEMYPGDWRVYNNRLYKGDELINNNFRAVDEIKNRSARYDFYGGYQGFY